MPRCPWLPFLARRVSGSREPDASSGRLGASMIVAPPSEPPRMTSPVASRRATTTSSRALPTSFSPGRWRKSPGVVASGTRYRHPTKSRTERLS